MPARSMMRLKSVVWWFSMPKKNPAKLTKVSVSLPFNLGSAEWTEDPSERNAAWCLYVELVTRISVQELAPDEGSIREALTSLYSLFTSTRQILREAGPDVAKGGLHSVGGVAIRVLNEGLRPFLAKWHIALRDWESKLKSDGSTIEHEAAWPENGAFRADLAKLRVELETYAHALAKLAGIEE